MDITELKAKCYIHKNALIEIRKRLQGMNNPDLSSAISMLRKTEGLLSWIETHGQTIKIKEDLR